MNRIGRVVLLLAFVFAACGGGGGDKVADDPAAALRAAAGRTAAAKSVNMSVTIGSGSANLASGDGAFDFANRLGRFNLSTTLGLKFDFIITPDKVYLKNPRPGEGRKPWVAVSPEDASGSPSLGFITQLRSQIDPRDALKNLGTTVTSVKKVGEGKVRGVATTHLRGHIDLSDTAIDKAPVEAQESLRAAQKQFGADGYPVDVWLDGDGRVRRFQYGLSVPGAGAGGASSKVTMDLYGYGEDPKIELPNPEDVEDEVLKEPAS